MRVSSLCVSSLLLAACAAPVETPEARLVPVPVTYDCPSLWVADRRGDVLELDGCSGVTRARHATGPEPAGIALDAAGTLFVSHLGDASIARWEDGEPGWYVEDRVSLEDPIALAFQDELWVVARDPGALARVSADGTTEVVVSSSRLDRAHDLAFGPDGQLYIAVSPRADDLAGVQVWSAEDSARVGGIGEDLAMPVALAFDGERLIVADWSADMVFSVPLDGGPSEPLFEVRRPLGLATASGTVFVTAADGVLRWDADSGLDLVRARDDELRDPRALGFVSQL